MPESLQSIHSRRKAVQNISQITKAMEVVSATKMRKAQDIVLRSRPYAWKALELLEHLESYAPVDIELSRPREKVKKTLVLVISSDRGLAGSFNSQVFRVADQFFKTDSAQQGEGHAYSVVAVGKKAVQYVKKTGKELHASFTGFGDYADSKDLAPLADLCIAGFEKYDWDRVITISTHFRTTLKQETLIRQILPLDVKKIRETVKEIVPEHGRYAELRDRDEHYGFSKTIEYIFEPNPEEAIRALVPHLVAMQIYHLILEANASEHSARRVAMKNASDNADELGDALVLSYNKVRQANITRELIEITGTQNALA